MVTINSHYLKLQAGYLFPEIGRRVRAFSQDHPQTRVIRLGIGDVTQPLPSAVISAAKNAFDDMATLETFKGYGPEQGYDFLREVIAQNEYASRQVTVHPDEIFISDGSKCDTGNIQELFSVDSKIAVTDPVYPVYVDSNVMAGRTGPCDKSGKFPNLVYLSSTEKNNFLPDLPQEKVDVIYLCFPNNPTGVVASKAELEKWVNYALLNHAVILFDAAYEAFITDSSIPHSIYEIEGARQCAIEFRSFSKKAGFTGTRCAFTVIPRELTGVDDSGADISLHQLWLRRQTTKFNGVSYPVQKAAAACYTKQGQDQIKKLISYYLNNASIILQGLNKAGFQAYGGINAPYIWVKTPDNQDSWEFFDKLLTKAHVVGTPGSGFGPCGQGYFRLSAFANKADVEEAMHRIQKNF